MTMLGKKHTEETKRKISLARFGFKHSKETKEKMSKNHHQLKEEFEKIVKELQEKCQHPIYRLIISRDNSVVGRGSL